MSMSMTLFLFRWWRKHYHLPGKDRRLREETDCAWLVLVVAMVFTVQSMNGLLVLLWCVVGFVQILRCAGEEGFGSLVRGIVIIDTCVIVWNDRRSLLADIFLIVLSFRVSIHYCFFCWNCRACLSQGLHSCVHAGRRWMSAPRLKNELTQNFLSARPKHLVRKVSVGRVVWTCASDLNVNYSGPQFSTGYISILYMCSMYIDETSYIRSCWEWLERLAAEANARKQKHTV